MKTDMPDIFPVFDKRDGQDCSHLQFKTWSEMGLGWNRYCEHTLSSKTRPTLADLMAFAESLAAQGLRIIAGALHNHAVSLAVLPRR